MLTARSGRRRVRRDPVPSGDDRLPLLRGSIASSPPTTQRAALRVVRARGKRGHRDLAQRSRRPCCRHPQGSEWPLPRARFLRVPSGLPVPERRNPKPGGRHAVARVRDVRLNLYGVAVAGNEALSARNRDPRDEFYTQLTDIEKELRHYRDQLRAKVVLCNCDDPYESNFFKYFAMNFNHLGLKKLIATCFSGSPIAGEQLSLLDLVTCP